MTKPRLAVVVGATGGIGAAFVEALGGRDDIDRVIGFSRSNGLDLTDEASIVAAAQTISAEQGDLTWFIDATGFLHGDGFMPEKSWRSFDADHFAKAFALNATGPALLMKHFLPLMAKDRLSRFATLSARVGSIGDNQLGGWYAYRASKAALNQIVHTTAIELKRKNPNACLVALHPGTVESALSDPFAKTGLNVRPPQVAVAEMLSALEALGAQQSGGLYDYKGVQIPW